MKSWYDYKKEITRRELLSFGWMCSFPFAGWIALLWLMVFKPHPKSSGWK